MRLTGSVLLIELGQAPCRVGRWRVAAAGDVGFLWPTASVDERSRQPTATEPSVRVIEDGNAVTRSPDQLYRSEISSRARITES
jgi:hypothetical protein